MSLTSRATFSFLVAMASSPAFPAEQNLLKNGGFEQGLGAAWGTGQYSDPNNVWQNSGACSSRANVSAQVHQGGKASLHIINTSPRAANVFGTTVQKIAIQPGQNHKITLWAKGRELASRGAISIIVDAAWNVRPIALPSGTFEWQKFEGTFVLPTPTADIRIISEDRGEVWIDDISVTPAATAKTSTPGTPALSISTLSYRPDPVARGAEAKITVDYDASANAMPLPVVEEWTLMFNDSPVMPSFRKEFEVRKDHKRHEITLPIPTAADLGTYTMKLRAMASGGQADSRVLIKVKE